MQSQPVSGRLTTFSRRPNHAPSELENLFWSNVIVHTRTCDLPSFFSDFPHRESSTADNRAMHSLNCADRCIFLTRTTCLHKRLLGQFPQSRLIGNFKPWSTNVPIWRRDESWADRGMASRVSSGRRTDLSWSETIRSGACFFPRSIPSSPHASLSQTLRHDISRGLHADPARLYVPNAIRQIAPALAFRPK
jgi:hypothetical protein